MSGPDIAVLNPHNKEVERDQGITYIDSETGFHILRDYKGAMIGIASLEVDAVRIVQALNVMQMLDDYYPELVFENIAVQEHNEYAETLKADIATVMEGSYEYS